ncbi:putative bifunctional diguanylate cyclase/phosphodiesterase [Aliikangiella coralliicola]|uniref:EAL domain-containing protein n=1 Tax=Aliikangiella coralliicola TaxID=2592383 RepID=A0A545U0E3_9GAMM|nr:EAL domain-containing protein [Aliikangiella coralliicola]TQV82893.1 EAL domain-containing protein [Aliikangiella coralliicola]
MPTDFLLSQKENQIKALRRLFALAVFCFAILLLLQAVFISRVQYDYQQDMMASVSQSILKELSQKLNTQRLKMALIHSNNKVNFDNAYNDNNNIDEKTYLTLLAEIRKDFPSSRLFTLISPTGKNLLQHITGNFLDDCQEEVMETVNSGRQQRLFLHRSKTSVHYDLIQPRNEKQPSDGYLFVAFNIGFITELLNKYQLPYQQLFLLRDDKQGFIEVSTEPESELTQSRHLSPNALAEFEHAQKIPDTRWNIAIRLDPETKSGLLKTALMQSFTTWSVVTILLYLALNLIKRNLESKYQAEIQLSHSRKQAETIINSVNEAVFSIDCHGKITFANSRAATLINKNKSEIIGSVFSDACQLFNLSNDESLQFPQILDAFKNNRITEYANLTLRLESGSDIQVAVRISSIYDQQNQLDGYTITLEDLSTAIELSKRLVFHESRDSLTGLINRRQLEKILSQLLLSTKSNHTAEQSAIILIDLDKFQLLNSSHGFEAGDEFLKRIAILLRQSVDPHHNLGRLSADEFAIILQKTNTEEIKAVCDTIKKLIRDFKFIWKNETLTASICLGVVIIDENFSDINEILSAADHACRLAKTKGTNITQYYQTDDPEVKKHAEEITQFVDLKKAINTGRFILYRQKITPTNSSKNGPQKYEILIRMVDNTGKTVAPVHFIPAAEKYGSMAKIDQWVIRNTFAHLAELNSDDQAHYNINISSKTLSDKKIISFVNRLFSEYGISPDRINFEVTETSAISYLDNALDFMHAMKSKGCSFSLDDFGTGLASFDYLKKLPIDYLKIDGIFVKDIESNPNDYAFIEAIHKISNQMGIKTVAEFVENETILNQLTNIGIDYAQGYHIHKPELWLPLKSETMDNVSQTS